MVASGQGKVSESEIVLRHLSWFIRDIFYKESNFSGGKRKVSKPEDGRAEADKGGICTSINSALLLQVL